MSRKNVLIALAVVVVAGAVVGANFYFKKEKGLSVTTDMLNEDKRRAVEIIVEEKAEARDPEDKDGDLPQLEDPRRRR